MHQSQGACTIIWESDVGRVEQVLRHELFINLRVPGGWDQGDLAHMVLLYKRHAPSPRHSTAICCDTVVINMQMSTV